MMMIMMTMTKTIAVEFVYILFAFIHSEIADLNQKLKAVKVAIVLVLADNTILI